MITIVNVLVGLGFVGTIALLASLLKVTTKIIDDLMEDYEELQLDYNSLKEDREYWMNMAVEMTDNYIDELDLPEPTIGENISMYYVEQLCRLTGIDNPLADIDRDKYLKDLTEEEWEAIRILNEELPVRFANIEWEEDDADDYYNDIFRELMGELSFMV